MAKLLHLPPPTSSSPLHSTGLLQLLSILRAQLEVSLGPDGREGGSQSSGTEGEGLGGGAGGGAHPFGVSMVEELLPDSFLRHALGAFFLMLQVRRTAQSRAACV